MAFEVITEEGEVYFELENLEELHELIMLFIADVVSNHVIESQV